MLEYSEGNPFCQEMDDGATLANHHKFLAVGVQLIDPLIQRNHAICLGMRRLKGGTHEQNVEAIEFCTQRAFGMSTKQIAHSCIADSAAKGILKSFDLKVGAKKSLVRVDRPVLELTSVGQTTRARAQLEFERRFCVNTTKEVTGVDVKLTKRDQLATLLDMRKTLLTYFPHITRELRYEMKALL